MGNKKLIEKTNQIIGEIYEELEGFDEIEKQIALTEARGEKIIEYLNKYKGQNIYNEIALAIEFGYQLALKQQEISYSEEDMISEKSIEYLALDAYKIADVMLKQREL